MNRSDRGTKSSLLGRTVDESERAARAGEAAGAAEGEAPADERPIWRDREGELWWRGQLVKSVRLDAVNQRLLLAVLEEQNWPSRIDDPLPAAPELEPKQRLRETIKSLNRGQRPLRVRFRCDGSGTGLSWEPVE
jgi:hypothetical protein